MKTIWRILPWCLLALFAAEIVAVLLPKKDGEYHVREFARLPVLLNGRIQPFDSVARNSLLQIRSMGDVPLEEVPSWKFWKHPKKLKQHKYPQKHKQDKLFRSSRTSKNLFSSFSTFSFSR